MKFARRCGRHRLMKPLMKCLDAVIVAVLCLTPLSGALAQSPGRRPLSRQPGVKPAAAPTPTPVPTRAVPAGPTTTFGPLAIVNDQTITSADLDPAVAEEMGNLERKIMQARLQIIELQINTILLDIESKKRKLSPQQLYDLEVTKRITDPTEAEIKQWIETNK